MWTPLTATVCFIQLLGTDITADPIDTDSTLFLFQANFLASCVDGNNNVVALDTDPDGHPQSISYTGSVPLVGDETKTAVRAKMQAAALAAFGDIDVPVVFL